jgi:hypothetical protein
MDAKAILEKFEAFLANISLADYRTELEPVKTVEQDLPKDLNPLPAIYSSYWVSIPTEFPNFENFFHAWWTDHLRPLDAFIRKYFWGCSHEFVYLGFKARLYRTLISVLTQFHFAYSWLAYCQLPLEASAELDMKGIDALVRYGDVTIALQIKKETYRSEARERGRFARRQIPVILTIEIPYTIVRPEEWQKRVDKARKTETRERNELLALLAAKLQRWLPNGFVVFQPDYPCLIERLIREEIGQGRQDNIGWQEILKRIQTWL